MLSFIMTWGVLIVETTFMCAQLAGAVLAFHVERRFEGYLLLISAEIIFPGLMIETTPLTRAVPPLWVYGAYGLCTLAAALTLWSYVRWVRRQA